MKTIVVATKNKGKVAEIAKALAHLPVKIVSLSEFGEIPEAVEDGATFEENALLKVKHYMKYTGQACLADDSGLEVDALGGAPGVYSARYAGEDADDAANNRKLLEAIDGVPWEKRSARFRCVLAFITETGEPITADGSCEGIMLEQPKGQGGFGYDPLFLVPDLNKTLAEISIEEKNQISHRGKALKQLAKKLEERLR